ncbi:hypothetical protein [Dokdonella sp.]|uniref:hypothetical protein n=1 Tax=Dokdonella sp. TaxID=2291710 RepID=UPI003C68B5B6
MIRAWVACLLLAAFEVASADTARRDAVFVLGEDAPGETKFFEPAANYYLDLKRRDVDLLVTGARSFQDVREWLVRSHDDKDLPWGRIVLVAHGSPWVGLASPLYADGTRADLPDLERAITRGEFPALPERVFDAQTQIVLESCGVGRRIDLLDLYARLLGGTNGDKSRVTASSNWVEFGQSRGQNGKLTTWRAERPFDAEIVPGTTLDHALEVLIRSRLAVHLRQDPGANSQALEESWRTAPVRIKLAMSDASQCRSSRVVRGLRAHHSVRDKLRGYGLQGKDLAWRVEQGAAGCTLVGEGTLAVLGLGKLSGDLLP